MTIARPLRSPLAALVVVAALGGAAPAAAGWFDVYRADAGLDLERARQLALETVADAPESPDAVAAAAWWRDNMSNLRAPAEIVDAAAEPRDPELAFIVHLVEGQLADRPPRGVLAKAEVAGPFGSFSTLDLERGVVPEDAGLPPLGTGWQDAWTPFRLLLETATGAVAPPEPMNTGGVYLAAWTLHLTNDVQGWLVVEAEGSFNLAVDGAPVARLRRCGVVDPGVSWYRVRMAAGAHRVRVEMASSTRPWVRLSLLDERGDAAAATVVGEAHGPWASSAVAAELPPADAALTERLAGDAGDVPDLMLAAALATARADPVAARSWLERAVARAPADPWPRLGLARFLLYEPTGGEAASDARRARDELRSCQELELTLLLEQTLAVRENRPEDAERLLTELVEEHGDDPRVLELWVREAIKRGWVREVDEGMVRLQAMLPASRSVIQLRLAALAALDRWQERRELLQTLLRSDTLDPSLVETAVGGCQIDDAVQLLEHLRGRFDSPGVDLSLARLELARGDRDKAAEVVERAGARWGDLPALDELRLVLAAGEPSALAEPLAEALQRDPGDLTLRSLSWREGRQPFYEPFRISFEDVLADAGAASGDVDAVLLLDQAVERLFGDGSSLYYYHGVTRALTPVGAQQASVLQPLTDTLWLRVRVHKADGSVEVPTDLSPHDGTVTLPDIKPGDVVEEEYVAGVGPTSVAPRGHLSPYIYRFADPERAFGRSEYVLLVPPEVDLRVEGNFTGLARKEWEQDGLRVIRWRADQVPPVQAEPFAPPTQELLPWVSYGFGVSWSAVGDGIRDRVLEVLESSVDLDRWGAASMTGDGPRERVRSLVSALCDRVQPGRAVLELSSSAGASYARREGNRLLILAAVLIHQGWDVDLVLARPRPLAGTHLGVPSLDTFSEPLLRVRRGGSEVWLDMEEQRRGFDHIRPILQGGDGLVLPLSDLARPVTILDELPSFPNPQLEQRVSVTAVVEGDGDAALHVEMELAGGEAERLQEQVASVSKERVSMAFEQMAGNLFPGAEEVQGKLTAVEGGAVLSFDLRLPGACEHEGDAMVCRSLVLGRPLVPALASLPTRSYPLILQLPIERRFTVTIHPPAGWTIKRQPRQLRTEWGSLTENLEQTSDGIRSTLTLQVPAQTIAPGDYPRFARFCHALDELMLRPPRLVAAAP